MTTSKHSQRGKGLIKITKLWLFRDNIELTLDVIIAGRILSMTCPSFSHALKLVKTVEVDKYFTIARRENNPLPNAHTLALAVTHVYG